MGNERIKANFAGLTTIFFWGITYISIKILLEAFNPIEILFIRFFLGIGFLMILYPKPLKIKNKSQEIIFAFAGLTGITFFYLLENIALTYTMASNVGVISALAPFFTGIISYFFMKEKEKLNLNFFIGFIIALIGISFISFSGVSNLKLNPKGDILAVISVIIWGIYGNLTKIIGGYGYNSIQATRRTFIYGVIFMIPALYFFNFDINMDKILETKYLFNFLFLGLGASAICFTTWNYTVKILGAVKTSVFIYLIPIVAVVTSIIVLDEKITLISFLGICFTLIGLIVSNKK